MADTIESTATSASAETRDFGTETDRLLYLVTHSLYSDRSVFLRELIANAADACDRRRIAALGADSKETAADMPAARVGITLDPDTKTLQVEDTGIGMNKDDLINSLGTIARSGTLNFLEDLKSTNDAKSESPSESGGASEGSGLIGQFGVGFYAVFMVADSVVVRTRKAGETQGWRWESDGKSAYSITPDARAEVGTTVIIYLKDEAEEFQKAHRIESIVKSWSNHLAIPVWLFDPSDADEEDTESVPVERQINSADAIWRRSKSDITPEDYSSFFRDTLNGVGEYSEVLHFQVEGMQNWYALLFVPATPPHDLHYADRRGGVRLYVRRNFVTDSSDELVPRWLRFLSGTVDSDDLPLAISREMLKNDPQLTRIRKALTTRVLRHLKEMARNNAAAYADCWSNYGSVLKEGLYDFMDQSNRDDLLELCRFWSMREGRMITLEEYAEAAGEQHNCIFTLTGEKKDQLLESPHLEAFRAHNVDVLISTDAVDDFWMPLVGTYKERRFLTASNAGEEIMAIRDAASANADKPEDEDAAASDSDTEAAPDATDVHAKQIDALLKASAEYFGDRVASVRAASHLVSSPMCLVSAKDGMTIQMERLFAAQGLGGMANQPAQYVLEINPTHPFVLGLNSLAETGDMRLNKALDTLLNAAFLTEGLPIDSPRQFSDSVFELLGGMFAPPAKS